ncbi:MAG: tetratricopeptide repeat protein [Alphaproteobacteria bacterium]|nr:tetratricopeptide repeat protein [Alphaproteobacteria bacterium]
MANALPLQSMDALSGMDARLEALDKLAELVDEAVAEKKRHRANVALKRAIQIWRKGDHAGAARWALRATEEDESHSKGFHVLAMALERMGHLHKALVTYERAFQLDPEDPELLINLGLTAWNLKLTEGAETMFRIYIAAKPDSPLGYNNLGSVLCDLGKPDDAIEVLKYALERMPHETILWNALGTVLAEEGRSDESLVFYEESVRLAPDFARAYHNLGYAYQHLGRLEEALENYDQALGLAVDPTEIREGRHSRSICLIGAGKLEEGFQEYEIRNDQRFRAYLHHIIEAPLWQGEPLAGKKLLMVGEQGLGDEFMFANILPDVQQALGEKGKLQIAVDPRLVPLFQRSFPKAEVATYDDKTLIDNDGNKALRLVPFVAGANKPDFWAPMGTALQYYRKSLADFPHEPFLTPDPARVVGFAAKLAALPGRKVGLCWRSMMLGAKRAKYFSPIEGWAPVLATPGVSFVNLQYGDCAEELARAAEQHGVTVHSVEGLDLKEDIDGAAALCAALDLVISAPTAAAAIAGSVGTETWFVTAGRTWPQLGTAEYPWYARTRVFWPEKFGDWTTLMPEVSDELEVFASGAERRPLVA